MRRLLLALALFVVPAIACSEASPFVPSIETANFAPSLGVNLAASTKTASGLYFRDIVVGGGAEVPSTGNTSVRVTYEGFLRSGVPFDSGSFPFTTNTQNAIAGMDEGVRGMRVGGQRQLIIPPSLGYGGSPYGSIPANSILVFDVILTNIY